MDLLLEIAVLILAIGFVITEILHALAPMMIVHKYQTGHGSGTEPWRIERATTTSASDSPITNYESLPMSDVSLSAAAAAQASLLGWGHGDLTLRRGCLMQAVRDDAALRERQGALSQVPAATRPQRCQRCRPSRRGHRHRHRATHAGGLVHAGDMVPWRPQQASKVVTTPMPLCTGLKKKASLTMETRVELYGKGRVKLSFDGVSEEAHSVQQQPPLHQDESVTSLVRRGGPSTAITPRRLSLEDRAPPPTPAPSLASLHKRTKSMDFGTIPLKDDDHPEPSNPV